MTKHLKVGITGGIGAGKSIISKIFSVLGVPVYDADTRAKWLMNTDPGLITSVKGLFGEEAYQANQLNKVFIGNVAFSRPELLEKLNKLVHPRVNKDYLDWVDLHKSDPYSLKEAALLFESGSYLQLDSIIYVSAPEGLRIQRVLKRDTHRTEADISNIIERQWPEDKKLKLSDHQITNDGDSLVIPQVLKFHSLLSTKVSG